MTTIYKLCIATGVIATGGGVVTQGDDHAETLKKLAAPLLADKRPDKGIKEIPVSEFSHLPFGVERIED